MVLLLFAVAPPIVAQIPDTFTNLRVLPEDIPREELIEIMRRFSLSLGVRCQYCHVGGDGISFEGVDFAKDDDPDKVKARAMLQMVQNINGQVLPDLPDRDEPSIEVSCKTCHRGRSRPVLLADELRMALDNGGPELAVQRYQRLREGLMERGMFDFGEWEVNLLAEELAREDRLSDAIAIYELNARYHPESLSIQLALGQLHESNDDPVSAIASYRRALELDPENTTARRRLDALGGT